MTARVHVHFGVRCSVFDVRGFPGPGFNARILLGNSHPSPPPSEGRGSAKGRVLVVLPSARSVAERQILFDPINVGGSEALGLSQRSPAFGTFALKQVASTGPPEQHFTRARDFETLGHRFSGSITFGTSHRLFIWVSAEISRAQDGLQIRKNPSGLELLSCQVAQMIS